jgi:hypothetical protein
LIGLVLRVLIKYPEIIVSALINLGLGGHSL